MDMFGAVDLKARREHVWRALNDPIVLKRCIPGCEDLKRTGTGWFVATGALTVGLTRSVFKGKVQLFDVEPPVTYTISGTGHGGATGFAAGTAKVQLDQLPDGGTTLSYFAEAKVGGALGQFRDDLVDSTAKELATQFLANLRELLEGQPNRVVPDVRPYDPI